jgi:hypothetical protein
MFENRRLSRINASSIAIVTILAFCAFTGCGKGPDNHAQAAKDVITELQSASDAMAGITDKASADTAAPKINDAADKIDTISLRIKKLPHPTQAENDSISAEVQPQMAAVTSKMQSSIVRLSSVPGAMQSLIGPMKRLKTSLAGFGEAVGGGTHSAPAGPSYAPSGAS